jgi:hypothetical protein
MLKDSIQLINKNKLKSEEKFKFQIKVRKKYAFHYGLDRKLNQFSNNLTNDKLKFIKQYLVSNVLFGLAAKNFIALSALSINTVYFFISV